MGAGNKFQAIQGSCRAENTMTDDTIFVLCSSSVQKGSGGLLRNTLCITTYKCTEFIDLCSV